MSGVTDLRREVKRAYRKETSIDVGPQTTYTLDGLMDGVTYSFAVTDYDTDGNVSGESNIVTVTMPSGPTLVSPPPEATLLGPTVHFTWTDGGAAVAEWWVSVGSSVGANDLLDSGSLGSGLSLRACLKSIKQPVV